MDETNIKTNPEQIVPRLGAILVKLNKLISEKEKQNGEEKLTNTPTN